MRGRGITKGGKNGESSCYSLSPKHFGEPAKRNMVKKRKDTDKPTLLFRMKREQRWFRDTGNIKRGFNKILVMSTGT